MKQENNWWQDRAWRIVQPNMSQLDMADLDAGQYVAELQKFHANTVIINTGGIIANYDTAFPFHYKNPYLTGDTLKQVIAACRENGIRVISRVDFSKVRKPVYENHPDWAFLNTDHNIIDYHGNIHVCFNSEYQQKHALDIMYEIITSLDPDGLFLNMEGYAAGYDYTNGWQGICQCENCQNRFFEFTGQDLPKVEDPNDPLYQLYLEFQRKTVADYYGRIKDMIAGIKPELLFFRVDMLRHEAGSSITDQKQNLYLASDLTKLDSCSYPEKAFTVTTVDFIDMKYRHTAVSPRQQELRIAQVLANGGSADYYMMGRLDRHADRSGYEAVQNLFRYHKEREQDYHTTRSKARIGLVKPSTGVFDVQKRDTKEYLGWYFLLTQHHYLFDCIESDVLDHLLLDSYEMLILPDIQDVSDLTASRLDEFVDMGGTIVAAGQAAQYYDNHKRRRSPVLASMGVERICCIGTHMESAYFLLEEKQEFPHFDGTDYVYLHDTYCYADYADTVKKYMKLIPPHRHSPAEEAYPTNITGYPAFTIHPYGDGKGVFLPWYPGREYFRSGFSNMENFMADLLKIVLNQKPVGGNLPPMVEVTHRVREQTETQYIHLINNTGFFNNSYFEPTTLYNLMVEIPWDGERPREVTSMVSGGFCRNEVQNGILRIVVESLKLFEAIRIR